MKYNLDWFKEEIVPKLEGYEIKFLNEEGDFGTLEGVQFDNDKQGGYVYFWSNGYIGLELIDFERDEDMIGDCLIEQANTVQISSMFNLLRRYLSQSA